MDVALAMLNPFAAVGMMMGANILSRQKMLARYLGETEYYDKVTDCPPVTLVHGRVYQIAVSGPNIFNNGWTTVRVYDTNGKYLTWVPYSVSWKRYWGLL